MSWEDEINQIEDTPSTKVVTSRGPGRPPGAKNGDRNGSMAPIVDWSPTHDRVVLLHVAMLSNSEIGAEVGLTAARVGQILNDPTGRKLIKEAQERLREKMSAQIEDGLVGLCVKALQNIRETIELDGLQHGTDFKKHQDKLSMELLKGRGHLPGDIEGKKAERPPISTMLAERLVDALEQSNEASRMAKEEAKAKEIVVQDQAIRDGDFVLVEK